MKKKKIMRKQVKTKREIGKSEDKDQRKLRYQLKEK